MMEKLKQNSLEGKADEDYVSERKSGEGGDLFLINELSSSSSSCRANGNSG